MASKSPIIKQLIHILKDALRRAENDECSEAEVYAMLNRFNAESKGYIDKDSTMNYDEAMEMLGIRNRNKFKDICRLHCIEQVKLNNMSVGFKRTEIEDLAYQMRKENGTD
jgi:hypothetical protein